MKKEKLLEPNNHEEGTTIVLGYKDVTNEKPAKEIRNTLPLPFEQDNF